MAKTPLDTVSESELLEESSEPTAELAQRSGLQSAADLAAERAAFAAEVAAQAAQRAVGLMERASGWVSLMANRMAQQEQPLPSPEAAPITRRLVPARGKAAIVVPLAQVSPEAGAGGITTRLKQAATSVGERIGEWSDGHYGLKPKKQGKKVVKGTKKSIKKLERRTEKAAKEAAKRTSVSWFPWVIGMSIGLVVGLVGVAYWQRQRLQRLWGETSQRVQQATETMRHRIEASRSPNQQALPKDVPPTTSNFRPLGSAPSVTDTDKAINGRLESTNP